jgi:hypothetical protein
MYILIFLLPLHKPKLKTMKKLFDLSEDCIINLEHAAIKNGTSIKAYCELILEREAINPRPDPLIIPKPKGRGQTKVYESSLPEGVISIKEFAARSRVSLNIVNARIKSGEIITSEAYPGYIDLLISPLLDPFEEFKRRQAMYYEIRGVKQ